MTGPSADAPSILFVCTANQCRSPLMEAFARRYLAGSDVTVASAGLLPGGQPMPSRGVAVAAQLGLRLAEHRSVQLDPSTLPGYDLIVTAAREQARVLVADAPQLWPRVFTLKQLEQWRAGRTWDRSVPLREWLETVAGDRKRTSLVGMSATDDVRDPVAGSSRLWRSVAAEIDANLRGGLVPLFLKDGNA